MPNLKLVIDNISNKYVHKPKEEIVIRPYHLIISIVDINPYRKGSFRYINYEAIKNSRNVAEALQNMGKGGSMTNIRHALANNYIKIERENP